MKTKKTFIATFLIIAAVVTAQNNNKQATVRMKKTVIVNGVEKTTDTTFTTSDPSAIKIDEGNITTEEITGADGKTKKIVVTYDNDEKDPGKDGKLHKEVKTIVMSTDGKMTPEDEERINKIKDDLNQGMLINGEEDKLLKDGQMVIIKKASCGSTQAQLDSVKEVTTIVIMKKIKITDVNDGDLQQLSKTTGLTDNNLVLDKVNFYPNPNNGKFHMAFTQNKKGNTDINIYDIEGKSIYNERLQNFSGSYDKELDISRNPKGVYFIKISQGSSSQVKKIVME